MLYHVYVLRGDPDFFNVDILVLAEHEGVIRASQLPRPTRLSWEALGYRTKPIS